MGLKKTLDDAFADQANGIRVPAISPLAQMESGTEAAIERLNQKVAASPVYKQRDFDAEAKGKVRCVMFEAALQSPAIAGLRFENLDEYLVLVKQAADAGVEYTWK